MRPRILTWLAVLSASAATLGTTVGAAVSNAMAADLVAPEAATRTLTAIDGSEYLSRGYEGEVPSVIHLALQAWVASCLGDREPSFRFGGWATAEQIVGVSPDVFGVQPFAITEMSQETGFAVITVRRGFWYFLPTLSHEMLHVWTGEDDGPGFRQYQVRCEIRSPLRFGMLPVLSPDSVAKLQALARR